MSQESKLYIGGSEKEPPKRSLFERLSAKAMTYMERLPELARTWLQETAMTKLPVETAANLIELTPEKPSAQFEEQRLALARKLLERIDLPKKLDRIKSEIAQATKLISIKREWAFDRIEWYRDEKKTLPPPGIEVFLERLDAQQEHYAKLAKQKVPKLEEEIVVLLPQRQRLEFIINQHEVEMEVRKDMASVKNTDDLNSILFKLHTGEKNLLGIKTDSGFFNLRDRIGKFINRNEGSLQDFPIAANLRSKIWELRKHQMKEEELFKIQEKEYGKNFGDLNDWNLAEMMRKKVEALEKISMTFEEFVELWNKSTKGRKLLISERDGNLRKTQLSVGGFENVVHRKIVDKTNELEQMKNFEDAVLKAAGYDL